MSLGPSYLYRRIIYDLDFFNGLKRFPFMFFNFLFLSNFICLCACDPFTLLHEIVYKFFLFLAVIGFLKQKQFCPLHQFYLLPEMYYCLPCRFLLGTTYHCTWVTVFSILLLKSPKIQVRRWRLPLMSNSLPSSRTQKRENLDTTRKISSFFLYFVYSSKTMLPLVLRNRNYGTNCQVCCCLECEIGQISQSGLHLRMYNGDLPH